MERRRDGETERRRDGERQGERERERGREGEREREERERVYNTSSQLSSVSSVTLPPL